MNLKSITEREIISLLFYQGADFSKKEYVFDEDLKEFYQIKDAYEAINMLLFSGTENENVRLLSEERNVDSRLLDHIDEFLDIYTNLYSAMCKYTFLNKDSTLLYTYRYDRKQSLSALQKGRTPSFFSTSLKKNIKGFEEKIGLVILEIQADPKSIHLNLNEVLGERSEFLDEEEILFPPYAKISIKKVKLPKDDLVYKDKQGKPPVGKYRVYINDDKTMERPIEDEEATRVIEEQLLDTIRDKDLIQNAKAVWEAYNRQEKPDLMSTNKYIHWKKVFQTYIKLRFSEIYQDIFHENADKARQDLLIKCINGAECEANRKREEYEKKLFRQSIVYALFRGVAVFFIALSLIGIENYETQMKIAAVLFSVISVFLREIFNGMSLAGKVRQRTVTFLGLDELREDVFLEKDLSEEKIEKYIERYKQIIREDNLRCIENLENMTSLPDNLTKKGSKEIIDEVIKNDDLEKMEK